MSIKKYSCKKSTGNQFISEIPEEWDILPLKYLVDTSRSITYGIVQAGPHFEEGIPYIRPVDMTEENGIAEPQGILRTSPEIAMAYERSKIKEGDLVCSIGPSFGKVMTVPSWLEGANLTQGTARVAIRKGIALRFIFWCLRSATSVSQWESSIGGATFRALNLGPLAETDVPKPSTAEQIAIASFLDREIAKIDALIAEQQRLIELLQEKRQAVISHAVTKGLNPNAPMKDSGVEWLGEVPEHWRVIPLRWAAKCCSGDGLSSTEIASVDDDVYTVRVIGGNGLMGYANQAKINYSLLAIGRVGALCGNVHIVHPPAWITDNALILDPDSSIFDLGFLSLTLQSRNLNEIASKTAQPLITGTQVSDQRIPCPPLSEQQLLASYLTQQSEQFDTLSTEAQRAIVLLQERRSALISAAVTGQIDVRGLEQKVAA